jgi:hypothetical protein
MPALQALSGDEYRLLCASGTARPKALLLERANTLSLYHDKVKKHLGKLRYI